MTRTRQVALSISGKSIVLTGGAGGIGRLLALALAESGARLTLIGRRPDTLKATRDEITRRGGPCHAIGADAREPAAIRRALSSVETASGRIDGLVGCAGTLGPVANVAAVEAEDWLEEVRSNVAAAFVPAKCALEAMLEAGSGRVILISSVAAEGPVGAGISAYAAAKAAIDRFVECAGAELVGRDVGITALHPTAIATPMIALLRQRAGESGPELAPLRDWTDRVIAGEIDGTRSLIEQVRTILASETPVHNGRVVAC